MPIPATDLALEAAEIFRGTQKKLSALPGVCQSESLQEGYPVSSVKVTTAEAARIIGKPEGHYITMDLQPYFQRKPHFFPRAVRCLAAQLQALLPATCGSILAVGLGNQSMTADAVGPLTLEHLLVTRHLLAQDSPFAGLRSTSALAPGVLSETGMEAWELIRGALLCAQPDALLVIDALAAHSPNRLCTCLQLSDTGLIPGSGVGNHRLPINRETTGIPVIALGLPTVIRAETLIRTEDHTLFVTPRDIDQRVRELSRLLGYGINLALQPSLTLEDISGLLG